MIVCVGYDDLLRVTLPCNLPHLDGVTVVTAPGDAAAGFAADRVRVLVTDAFYRGGAHFNKGAALEEALADAEGWTLVMDADIMLPAEAPLPELRVGCLYNPRRRILEDWSRIPIDWNAIPIRNDLGSYGYFQLFHSDDPVLASRPWYPVDWVHAGGCDNEFQRKWAAKDRVRLSFEVLHLGTPDRNWFGRRNPRGPELQEALKRKHGWGRRKTNEVLCERLNDVR